MSKYMTHLIEWLRAFPKPGHIKHIFVRRYADGAWNGRGVCLICGEKEPKA